MYKLLIADDEQIERSGLKMMVERSHPAVEVVGEAANGREAVEAVERHHPDIVTMDIKMPGIDGLQASREILKRHPSTKIVIFSAYDTFAYAQEAIQLGIKDYVLKPYTKEEIVKVLNRIVDIIEKERSEQAEKLAIAERYHTILPLAETEWMATVIFGHVHEVSERELSRLLNIHETGGGYILLLRIWRKDHAPVCVEHREKMYTMVKKQLKQLAVCLVGPLIGQQIPIAVFESEKKTEGLSHRSKAMQLFRTFSRRLQTQRIDSNLCYAGGVGRFVENVQSMRYSYQEALLALRRVHRHQQLCFYEDVERSKPETGQWLLHKEKQLLEAVRQGETETGVRLFDEFFDCVVEFTGHSVEEIRRYLSELFVVLLRVSGDVGTPDDTYTRFDAFSAVEEMRETAILRLRQIVHMVKYRLEQQHQSYFEKAKAYLDDHFQDNVTLETVARHVGLSTYYFSKLFKERAGVTFIDYLTQLRVEKAKHLLLTSDKSLKEICFEVGYRDPNYFSRVFKKTTGVTPSAFRRQGHKKV